MARIQIITIIINFLFLAYISRLIIKGKLREEYAIVWIACTLILLVFSFWTNGLEVLARTLGVYQAPNLVFTGAIFTILIYLLHLSVVASKLHMENKKMAQSLAIMQQELESIKEKIITDKKR